jgi:DNA-binding PadR family transcriptional regulator
MAKKKHPSVMALVILSLLAERPMHSYQMLATMKQREMGSLLNIQTSSLYKQIEDLTADGLVQVQETEREGRYPERTRYSVTESGRAFLMMRLQELLAEPVTEYPVFTAALSLITWLSPEVAGEKLEQRIHALKQAILEREQAITRAQTMQVDRIFLLEDEYSIAVLQAQIAFLKKTTEAIYHGNLTRTVDGTLQWNVQRLDLSLLPEDKDDAEKKG